MKGQTLIAGITVLLSTFACMATELPYRLVGIVSPSDGEKLVLIESADGKQKIYHLHDDLGDGTIVEISQRTVSVQRPGGEIVLQLSGHPSREGAQDLTPDTSMVVATRTPSQKAQKGLHRLLSQDHQGDEAQLASTINTLLGLPKAASIVAVNGRSTNSPGEGLKALLDALDKGEPTRLTIGGVDDLDEVYVLTR